MLAACRIIQPLAPTNFLSMLTPTIFRYWDWSLDWNNFVDAPVWDNEHGFGGDGDVTGDITVGEGRCVAEGPFAGLEAMFYDDEYHPHCLSRGFLKGAALKDKCRLI